jgi:predicted aspartyl protease
VKKAFRMLLGLAMLIPAGSIQGEDTASTNSTAIGQAVPFELTAGFLITVKGSIGKLDGLSFILDTGTQTSVVDRRIADRLRVPRHRARVFSFQKYVLVERAEFPEVQFGPVKAMRVLLSVADLGKISEFSGHADAIIGMDLLSMSKIFRIDYNSGTVWFLLRETTTVDTLQPQHPRGLIIPLMVQGQTVHLLVDTGLKGILLYEDRLRKKVPDLRLEGKPRSARVGWMQARAATLPGVKWRNSEKTINVLLTEGPPDDILPGVDGYLGTSSLKAEQIEFDFQEMRLNMSAASD